MTSLNPIVSAQSPLYLNNEEHLVQFITPSTLKYSFPLPFIFSSACYTWNYSVHLLTMTLLITTLNKLERAEK